MERHLHRVSISWYKLIHNVIDSNCYLRHEKKLRSLTFLTPSFAFAPLIPNLHG